MDPIEIVLSRTYTLIIEEAEIGRARAVRIVLRHQRDDGPISMRGGFLVFVDSLPQMVAALDEAHKQLHGGW